MNRLFSSLIFTEVLSQLLHCLDKLLLTSLILDMVKKQLSEDSKKAVIRASERGDSVRLIASQFGISIGAVSQICNRFQSTGGVSRVQGSGRPRKSSEKDDRALVRIVKKDPLKTATDVTKHANERLGLGISTRTARRILK